MNIEQIAEKAFNQLEPSHTRRMEGYVGSVHPEIVNGQKVLADRKNRMVCTIADAIEEAIGECADEIRGKLIELCGDDTIDGGGCESGDPLDVILAEIDQAFSRMNAYSAETLQDNSKTQTGDKSM